MPAPFNITEQFIFLNVHCHPSGLSQFIKVFLTDFSVTPVTSLQAINTIMAGREVICFCDSTLAKQDLPCCLFEPAVGHQWVNTRLHVHRSWRWQWELGFVGTMKHQSSTDWLLRCHTPLLHQERYYLGSSIGFDCPCHNLQADLDLVGTRQ